VAGVLVKLRGYQDEAVGKVLAAFQTEPSALIVMPTGTGKTVTFAEVIRQMPTGRAMVLAHREELIRQAAAKIAAVTGEAPEIEMATERADVHMFQRARVVVATVQTLATGRLKRFNPRHFGLIVTDEAHHAVAGTYTKIFKHFQEGNPSIKHLGVTATPDRTDLVALGKIFSCAPFVYELSDAIEDGYLVPIVMSSVHVEGLDFSQVRTTAGDLNGGDLARVMEYERNLHAIAKPSLDLAKWRKVLVFAASVAHAERLAEIFNRYRPGSARWVCGGTPKDERRQILRDYADGTFQFLVNVGVFTEGFDEPTIDMVVMGRPTESRSLFSQMAGRGTRPLTGIIDHLDEPGQRRAAIAHSSKPNLEVIDFRGNAGRHKLVTATDILGGRYPADVVAKAKANIAKAGTAVGVSDALKVASEQVEQARQRDQERRKKVMGNAEFRTEEINVFNVFDLAPPLLRRNSEVAEPATDKQVAFLQRNGIAIDAINRRSAGMLCREIIDRREKGLATFKQSRILKRHGFATDVTFDEASRLIDRIFKRGAA
jgi:superfamily II DNA or RNA helicase